MVDAAPTYRVTVTSDWEIRRGVSVFFEPISKSAFVSGHDFSPAVRFANDEGFKHGFTGCGKTKLFEGDGLQVIHKRLKIGPALAAEGTAFAVYSTFFRSLFSPVALLPLDSA